MIVKVSKDYLQERVNHFKNVEQDIIYNIRNKFSSKMMEYIDSGIDSWMFVNMKEDKYKPAYEKEAIMSKFISVVNNRIIEEVYLDEKEFECLQWNLEHFNISLDWDMQHLDEILWRRLNVL